MYKVLVRSAMVYACPVWSYTCKTNYNKLQVQQNKFLRLAGKYPMYTPIFTMHKELNVKSINNYVKKLASQYFFNLKNHCSTLIQEIDYSSKNYKHKRLMQIIK